MNSIQPRKTNFGLKSPTMRSATSALTRQTRGPGGAGHAMGQSSPLVEHSRESAGLSAPVCTSPSNVMNSSTDSVLSVGVGTPPITPPYSRSKTPTGPAPGPASLQQPGGSGGGAHRVSVSGSAAGTPNSSSGRGSKTSESDAASSALLAATELSASTSTISTLTPENSEGSIGTRAHEAYTRTPVFY